jgi:hypothetical protein
VYCFECVCVILCLLCIVLCIVVPLPPGTYPLAVNNNNNNNKKFYAVCRGMGWGGEAWKFSVLNRKYFQYLRIVINF